MRKGNVFYFIATGTFTLICSRVGNMRILFCMRPSCLSSLSTPFPSVGIGSLHFPRNGAVFVVFSVVLCTALPNNCNIVLRFVELLRSRENLFAVRKRSLLSRQLFCLPLRYFRLTCLFISFPETHGILYLPPFAPRACRPRRALLFAVLFGGDVFCRLPGCRRGFSHRRGR